MPLEHIPHNLFAVDPMVQLTVFPGKTHLQHCREFFPERDNKPPGFSGNWALYRDFLETRANMADNMSELPFLFIYNQVGLPDAVPRFAISYVSFETAAMQPYKRLFELIKARFRFDHGTRIFVTVAGQINTPQMIPASVIRYVGSSALQYLAVAEPEKVISPAVDDLMLKLVPKEHHHLVRSFAEDLQQQQ